MDMLIKSKHFPYLYKTKSRSNNIKITFSAALCKKKKNNSTFCTANCCTVFPEFGPARHTSALVTASTQDVTLHNKLHNYYASKTRMYFSGHFYRHLKKQTNKSPCTISLFFPLHSRNYWLGQEMFQISMCKCDE